MARHFRADGTRIRAERERRGLLQTELARRLGIDQAALSNIERGRKNPSPVLTTRIALELGVTFDDITVVIADELESA